MTINIHKLIKIQCLIFLFLICGNATAGEIAIIINEKNPAVDLSDLEIKQLYLKNNTHWKHGKKIRPAAYSYEADIAIEFYSKVLFMTETEVERHWIEVQYGKALKPPVQLDDSSAMLKFIGKFKGSIGFVELNEVANNSKVKVLKVIDY